MAFLDRVLAALERQRCSLPWDLLAVDSGSTDGTWECLGRWSERFPLPFRRLRIEQDEFDHGDTRNLLASQSCGDLLVFLTQDAIPRGTDWLERLAANFVDDRVGAAYCRNVPRPDADVLTKIISARDLGYRAGRREVRLPDAATYSQMNPHERRELYNFNDVASALRRDLWERHPFPRTWFGEDLLQARAFLEAGYTVVYDDEAVVEHSHDYDAEETYRRARIDGRFNAEWLGRVCVESRSDARVLEKRVLAEDERALREEGFAEAEVSAALVEAAPLRRATFDGLHDGGRSEKRYPRTKMLKSPHLKVLYVVHGFPPDTWAGTEVYTLNLAREIRSRGHEVVILARSPAFVSVAEGGPAEFSVREDVFEDLRVLRITNRIQPRNLTESYWDVRADAAFRRVIAQERPDVVHFQHLIHLSASLVEVAREEGLPTLFTLHDYWALCARVQLIRPDGVRCEENQGAGCYLCVKNAHFNLIPAAKASGHVLGPIAGLAANLAGHGEYKSIMARHELLPAAYASADLRVAPSRFLRGKFLDTGKFDAHTTVFSAYGMRTDHVRPDHGRTVDKRRDSSGGVRFGFIGTLVWYKGGDVMVKAMGRLAGTNCVLNVFGDFKPETDEHHAALRDLAGPNVVFRGRFDNAKLADVYSEIDVLIVPSVWFENAPLAIQEAHLMGTPVVTSDVGGMAELVRDNIDGLHFKVGNDEDLAVKLRRFVDEPQLSERLSEDFPHIKSMGEDAASTEFRYRQLVCLAQARNPIEGERLVLDASGVQTARRAGVVEQQGADMLLLRPGTSAAAEYDVTGAGGGLRKIRIEQYALGGEPDLTLGLRVRLEDTDVGEVLPFTSEGRDGVHTHEFEFEMPSDARRLRLETWSGSGDETYARIRRVQVLRVLAVRVAAAT